MSQAAAMACGTRIHGFVGLEMGMRMNLILNGNGKGNGMVFEWDGFTLIWHGKSMDFKI